MTSLPHILFMIGNLVWWAANAGALAYDNYVYLRHKTPRERKGRLVDDLVKYLSLGVMISITLHYITIYVVMTIRIVRRNGYWGFTNTQARERREDWLVRVLVTLGAILIILVGIDNDTYHTEAVSAVVIAFFYFWAVLLYMPFATKEFRGALCGTPVMSPDDSVEVDDDTSYVAEYESDGH